MSAEIWKPVKGYEDIYKVSNKGVVTGYRNKALKPYKIPNGYLQVCLYKDQKAEKKYIHRLVAEAFIPNPENFPQINHIDENKENNCVDNLEWCSALRNMNHGSRKQRQVITLQTNKKLLKSVDCYSKDGVLIGTYESIKTASEQTGANQTAIALCCKGRPKYKTAGAMFGNITKVGVLMAIKMIQLDSREEWLKHRQSYIGGSEASAIIGKNPYMSNTELWEYKTGLATPEDISDKPYVQFGINAEPLIRELFILTHPKYEMHYAENNSWLNDKYPFAAASLDGWLTEKETGKKGVWESKTSEIVSSMHKEKWQDQIPDNYYIQLLHYLLVREDCDFAHLTALLTFKFGDKEVYQQIKNYHIERSDVESDIQYLANHEKEFWGYKVNGKKPPLILPDI